MDVWFCGGVYADLPAPSPSHSTVPGSGLSPWISDPSPAHGEATNLLETSPDVKVYLLTGTARGVVYLHSHTPPIAHYNLTARNLLVDSGLTAKIADLGVARMVSIQPGQLAATMTAGPGNNLYMPPEIVQEQEIIRYNTAKDIFSCGVVSLQTFPKDLKPHTYCDSATKHLVGRTEIERCWDYIQLMITALGGIHPLVKLTLNCLSILR